MNLIINNIWIAFKISLVFIYFTATQSFIEDMITNNNFNFMFSFMITYLGFSWILIIRFIYLLPYLVIMGIKNKKTSYSVLYLILCISILASFISIDQYEFLTGEIKFYDPFDTDFSWLNFLQYGFAFVITFLFIKFRINSKESNAPAPIPKKEKYKKRNKKNKI